MIYENTDERYTVAEDAICDAFLILVNEKELEKITVSDVIKKAGIVRSTFYAHYQDMPQLISKVEDRTVSDIFLIMGELDTADNSQLYNTFFQTICDYVKSNPYLIKVLTLPRGEQLVSKLITMFHRYIMQTLSQTQSDDIEMTAYNKAFLIGGTIAILHKWVNEDMQTDSSIISGYLSQHFLSILS